MGTQVVLPFWGVAVLAVLAAVALTDRLVVPLAGRIAERRRQRRIDRLNSALSLPLSPFKTAPRRSLVEQILRDPDVLAAIEEQSASKSEPREATAKRARAYAAEIVPTFSTTTYFRIGARMARWLSEFLYRVRVAESDRAQLARIEPKSSVVLVMNHRSNMDYVLVTHLAARSSALSYAVGEWARVPVLSTLIRLMGAYFIRRDSSDPLYRRVLACYVRLATAAGVTQAVFPEGGLSRNGALQPARLGLLTYITQAFDAGSGRDVVFVPVGLNYDRVLEDRVLTAAAATPKGEKPRFAAKPGLLISFIGRNVLGRLTGTRHRYGYACVSFGAPVSLAEHLRNRGVDFTRATPQERSATMERLAERLMGGIGRAVPALPVSLVAAALLEAEGRALSPLELKGAVIGLIRRIEGAGGAILIPRADQEYAIEFGIKQLIARRLIVESEGLAAVAPGEAGVLAFYANGLVHHLGRAPWPVTSA